jgi:NAD+ kinase
MGKIFKNAFFDKDIHFGKLDDILPFAKLAIALGGDGTMLRVARHASPLMVPVLGINLGRVGYMATIEANEIYLIDNYFEGRYTRESRMMLDIDLERKSKVIKRHHALNDVVISRGSLSKIIDVDLSSDKGYITSYRADGIIIATPTGSTAYSLSAGGPVVEPGLDSLIVTPICAYSLYTRPLILSDKSILEISFSEQNGREVFFTVDGEEGCSVLAGDIIRVQKSPFTTVFIKIKNTSFYEILNMKLTEGVS